jgi:hypothetical protein
MIELEGLVPLRRHNSCHHLVTPTGAGAALAVVQDQDDI